MENVYYVIGFIICVVALFGPIFVVISPFDPDDDPLVDFTIWILPILQFTLYFHGVGTGNIRYDDLLSSPHFNLIIWTFLFSGITFSAMILRDIHRLLRWIFVSAWTILGGSKENLPSGTWVIIFRKVFSRLIISGVVALVGWFFGLNGEFVLYSASILGILSVTVTVMSS